MWLYIRIITVNLPISYIRAIKTLTTGDDKLFPSRSELIRVAVREWLIKELEAAKSFAVFTEKYPKSVEIKESPEKSVEEFEVDIDGILGLKSKEEKREEPMASDIKYKTMAQQMFQKIPTMTPPLEYSGRVVDMGNRVKIDGKVFNLK